MRGPAFIRRSLLEKPAKGRGAAPLDRLHRRRGRNAPSAALAEGSRSGSAAVRRGELPGWDGSPLRRDAVQLLLVLDDLLDDVVRSSANRNLAAVDHERGRLVDIQILGQLDRFLDLGNHLGRLGAGFDLCRFQAGLGHGAVQSEGGAIRGSQPVLAIEDRGRKGKEGIATALLGYASAIGGRAGGSRVLRQRIALKDDADRKSTRLNSSHLGISYAVFCFEKKKHRLHQVSRSGATPADATGPGRTAARDYPQTAGVIAASLFFFFNDTATPEIYTLSLHDALPISALAAAEDAAHLHVGAGLGEGEERRIETRLHRRAEQRLHRVVQRALQVAEGDVGVHRQAFDLVEYRRVGGVERIVAMHLAGDHDAHRRRLLLHGANLHRRSVGAQQQTIARGLALLAGDEQRVLRIARGMVRREVERLEVVVVGLDLGAFADGVAHRFEYGDDLVHHAQHGMLNADGALNAGESDVEARSHSCYARHSKGWQLDMPCA